MSYLKTKATLTTQLLTLISTEDLAEENSKFNPANKSLWYAAYFIPATSETTGKTLASSDEDRGIFQVSVFTPINKGYDNAQLQAIDDIRSGFLNTTSIVYNDQTVDILESTVNNGQEFDGWFKRDISINYLSYSERV